MKDGEISAAIKLYTAVYYIYYILILFIAFLRTTMFPTDWEPVTKHMLILGAAVLIAGNLLIIRKWKPRELIPAGILCGSLMITWYLFSAENFVRVLLLSFAALIFGAHGLSGRKILVVHFAICAALLAVTIAAALTGRIPNLVYIRENNNRLRYSFGIVYTTDFAAHIFYLSLTWVWIRARKIRWGEIFLILAAGLFTIWFCDARTTFICLILLFIFLVVYKMAARKGRETDSSRIFGSRAVKMLLLLFGPAAAVIMIGITYIYTPDNRILAFINQVISNRLYCGHQAFDDYNVRLWGQPMTLIGLGGTTTPPEHYFFLDCSYVNILFQYGPVVLFGLLMCFVLLIRREWKEQCAPRLAVLILCLLACCMEHHMIEISYDPFPLLLLAVNDFDKKRAA